MTCRSKVACSGPVGSKRRVASGASVVGGGGHGRGHVRSGAIAVAALAIAACASATQAQDWTTSTTIDPSRSQAETWSGAEGRRHGAAIWTGLTYAPFGTLLHDGLRLRAVGGAGRYHYDSLARLADGSIGPRRYTSQVTFAEAVAGYQMKLGTLTAKAFAGVAWSETLTTPHDPSVPDLGAHLAPKGALELWLDIGASAFAQLDAGWSSHRQTTQALARLGWRVTPELSGGIEAGVLTRELPVHAYRGTRTVEHQEAKAGLFARYEFARGEISLSGGMVSEDRETPVLSQDAKPYAAATWLWRF